MFDFALLAVAAFVAGLVDAVVGGGGLIQIPAMFAMFPYAYATIFSGFYTAFVLLLVMLIFRAASIELRGKLAKPFGIPPGRLLD